MLSSASLHRVPSGVIWVTQIGFTAPDDTAGAFLVAEESCFMFSQKVSVSEKGFKTVY